MANLVSELRRRNVFRVAGLYLVVSWLLLQLAAFLEDALKLPDWFDGMVTALVLLGFPVALILAWAFELTPDGVRRTAASESSAPVRPVDWVLVVLLTFVSGMLVWSRVDPPYQEGSAAPRADVGAVPKDVAVAVLPFADLSPEGDQNYFSDGLAEELLNVLRRDAGIRVAGRTSSFAFKGKGAGVQQIAESLNVTHVVEGSVRKAGERIRVSVQLINAADGFPVFSESYDRKLEDIFAVQDDIARSVGRALQLRFSLSERNPPDDVGAYEDYLTARELLYTRVVPNMVKASTLLGSAIDRAPSYAPAYATKAVATMLLSNMQGGYGERESREALAEAKTFIDRALELDPQLPDAHAALGLYLESAPGKGDPVPALTRALELDPNHTEAQLWLANAMPASKESFARLERLVDQDPAFIPAVSNLTNFYTQRAEFDRARAILTRAASVPGMKARVAPQQASLEIAAGELAKAYELAKSAYEREPGNMGAKATLGFALMMLGEFEESARVGILVNQVASAWAANTLGEAIRLVEAQPPTRSLADLVPSIYVEAGRYQDAVNYFEAVFGEDVALKDLNGLGSSVASLAYAYRKIGDTERSEQLIELARTVVRKGRALGYSNLPSRQVFIAEVEGAAGNIEAARSEISSAIKNGLVGAIAKSPVLEKVFPRSEMAPGIDVIFERTNAQRAKLGWPPIEPPRPEG